MVGGVRIADADSNRDAVEERRPVSLDPEMRPDVEDDLVLADPKSVSAQKWFGGSTVVVCRRRGEHSCEATVVDLEELDWDARGGATCGRVEDVCCETTIHCR